MKVTHLKLISVDVECRVKAQIKVCKVASIGFETTNKIMWALLELPHDETKVSYGWHAEEAFSYMLIAKFHIFTQTDSKSFKFPAFAALLKENLLVQRVPAVANRVGLFKARLSWSRISATFGFSFVTFRLSFLFMFVIFVRRLLTGLHPFSLDFEPCFAHLHYMFQFVFISPAKPHGCGQLRYYFIYWFSWLYFILS